MADFPDLAGILSRKVVGFYLTDLFLHPALAAVSELSDSSNNLASLYCLFLLICANFLITNTISLLSSLRTQEDGC